MSTFIQREPAIFTALVVAVINIAAAFGFEAPKNNEAALVPVAVSLLIVLAGWFVRQKVTPVAPKPPVP